MKPGETAYLGDGVYLEYDGWGWTLTTELEIGVQTIYIDGPADAKRLAQMMGVIK